MARGVTVTAGVPESAAHVLSHDALQFVADVHRGFNARRLELLEARTVRKERAARCAARRLSHRATPMHTGPVAMATGPVSDGSLKRASINC